MFRGQEVQAPGSGRTKRAGDHHRNWVPSSRAARLVDPLSFCDLVTILYGRATMHPDDELASLRRFVGHSLENGSLKIFKNGQDVTQEEAMTPSCAAKAARCCGSLYDPPAKAIVLCVDEDELHFTALERAQGYLSSRTGAPDGPEATTTSGWHHDLELAALDVGRIIAEHSKTAAWLVAQPH